MFIFQMQAESDSTSSPSHFGMRNRKKNFSEDAEALSVIVDSVAAEMLSPQSIKDKDVSDFISVLTPGAQNAIRAASFAWGYENATKYVKNAMKLDEVKNADNAVEKSKAVIESVSTQAGQNEKTSEVSKFVWGYYNEDLKDTQAQASKTETLSEKSKTAVQLESESLRLAMPSSSHDAAVNAIGAGNITPALAYCASAYQDAEAMQEQRVVEQKRDELAKLITVGGPHAVHSGAQKTAEERQRDLVAEAANLALSRRDEEVQAFQKAEKQLNDAIKTLDKFSEDEKDAVKKIAQMLPRELASLLIADARRFSKKRALRAQLAKWVAFSISGRKSLSAVPAANIIKLATLSTFLRRGK